MFFFWSQTQTHNAMTALREPMYILEGVPAANCHSNWSHLLPGKHILRICCEMDMDRHCDPSTL